MRYEKYKKSISPFLEEIPFHWKETYLSHAYSLSSDTGHTEEQLLSVFLDKGVVSYSSTDQKQVHKPSEDMSKYQLVNPGDFVINNQQAWRGSVGISRYKGIVSPAYYIWRPREDNNPYYMNYLFRDHYIIDQFVLASKGVGSIQRQVYVPYMKRIILSIPPREEQNQIVRYLDWQVSKINKLIHGYQRQIKLMEERRQTVIDRAVTKGVRQGRHTLKDATDHNTFDTVIVVTDRVNLDKQIRNTIRQFMQVSSTVGWAKDSSELGTLLEKGTKIIITIVHKFQFILEDISKLHTNRNFAILIDEAHSSQNGDLSTKMNIVLSGSEYDNDDLLEDKINTLIDGKKLAKNASYFAFTATPKNKTLEVFGREEIQPDGSKRFFPHYVYTMKQAIEEHFIMDVLRYYTPIQSFYKLSKTVEDDPLFDKKKAQRLLRYYVESNQYAIEQKAGIIVEHFHTEVIGRGKIGGRARAMVITSGIPRAIEYYKAINALLEQRKSPYKTIIAFSGTTKYEGREVTEADLNGFTSSKIERAFKKDPYRILIVANKFQTGFDEPLLHTMYVDKGLSDIKAVQTLSRLNRSAPDKNDTFILDFVNDPGVIKAAFDKYYKTTILSGETDVNKLNDQISEMESLQVYTHEDVDSFVEAYLDNAPREELDPILDRCTENYKELIPEEQILFKSNAKGFVRTYNFLSAILPYGSVEWEKLSIFLKLLIGKLPSPAEDDNISGLLEDIDLESYRAVAQDTMRIQLDNENGELNPIPVSRDVGISVPELDPLTQILKEFHDAFGGIDWTDEDKVKKQVADLPAIVSKDEAYQNAIKNSDAQNARVESDRATMQAILDSMSTTIELYKAVNENPALCKWIQDMVFANTYQTSPPAKEDQPDFD